MRTPLAAFLMLMIVASCGVGNNVVVRGAGPNDLLKLRTGPGLDRPIIMGLPDGTRLSRGDCVPEKGQFWCKVSLTTSPGISGYVSADYLSVR